MWSHQTFLVAVYLNNSWSKQAESHCWAHKPQGEGSFHYAHHACPWAVDFTSSPSTQAGMFTDQYPWWILSALTDPQLGSGNHAYVSYVVCQRVMTNEYTYVDVNHTHVYIWSLWYPVALMCLNNYWAWEEFKTADVCSDWMILDACAKSWLALTMVLIL